MTYTEVLNELRAANVAPHEGEYYDYAGFPMEELFEEFFNFAQEYLLNGELPDGVKPARIFYNTNTDNNAGAWNSNGFSLIEIFKGSLFWMHTYCNTKENLFEKEELQHYVALTGKKGVSPTKFMLQMLTIFYLYHETGHLIQRREDKADYLEFIDGELTEDEIKVRHSREHDADWFASTCLAQHVRQYCETETEEAIEMDSEMLATLLPLAIATLYLYFIHRMKTKPELYYLENSHPHPSIRLIYLIVYLTDNLADDLPKDVSMQEKVKSAITLCSVLMSNEEENLIDSYNEVIFRDLDKIEEHINVLRNSSEEEPTSCINYLTAGQ